ncbi:hypothetical protein B5X24_HaOG205348 [Helicoverpa armigera]|uniref:Uncharacterized protein n=1 Tax=Helicoverpa armigera TaxID=29058 RepID=A0A2W1BTD8_HELAM|nr:hypothetical protein B5X24_HaOG205348 [Helicoverpa armigera]
MLLNIPMLKLKEKVTIFFVILFIFAGIYFYLNHLQQNYDSAQWSGERCLSELTSIKYQLNVVTEYKNRIDKLLTETQKAHDAEKERYKDVMDSCVAMKQQTAICQSQFEDLQIECKKVREDYNKAVKDLEKLKAPG